MNRTRSSRLLLAAGLLCLLATPTASRALAQEQALAAHVPADVRVQRDVPYGADRQQTFDVYRPTRPVHGAPVIFMVHGGGWRRGDKARANVVESKVARWVAQGFILVSTNYRLLPDTKPLAQAGDVAAALAAAQAMAASWGGDARRFIVMGHSAGAHLVSLLTADPTLGRAHGVQPWLGTISLDSAAMNVAQVMEMRHPPLYDQAFGDDPAYWRASSPFQQLRAAGAPMLLVCSRRRRTSCPQARAFEQQAQTLDRRVRVLPEDLSHGEINATLGQPSAYTRKVEMFMASLDPRVARLLRQP